MSHKQQGLGLSVTPEQAIQTLPIETLRVGSRKVSAALQKAFLHYLNGYESKECWKSAADIAADPKMQKLSLGISERSVRVVIKALQQCELVETIPNRSRAGRSVRLNMEAVKRWLAIEYEDSEDFTVYEDFRQSDNKTDSGACLGVFNPDRNPKETGPTVLSDRTNGPFRPDRRGDLNRPTVRPQKKKKSKENNPTPETGWEGVVSFLESHGVKSIKHAIDGARKSFASPSEALNHLQSVRAAHATHCKLPGILANQCQHPTPLHFDAPKPPPPPNYVTLTHWEDNNRCSREELQRVYPGRPLDPRLVAMFDSIRKEATA
jgi:hypothetical protein